MLRQFGFTTSLLLFFSLFLSTSIWANPALKSGHKFKVVTTFTVIADMARNVAGDAAIVTSITKPDAEIHNYQTTPGDIRRAQGADLIIYNGLNLELWFDKFFHNLRDVPSVVVTEGIVPMGIAKGPYSGKPNPHAWMSADNALVYIENIRQALVKYDSKNTAIYNQNAKRYSAQILAAVKPFKLKLATLPKDKRWLVTSEGAFSYLARDYDLKELYLWPINADAQGTPQQVRKVIDEMKANNIVAIFSESTVSARPAQQVARETGSRYAGVLYVDSLSAIDGPVPTYIDLLKITLSTIAEGLNQ
ncbi:Manganese ABC transporter, periplasmic-binding protein SitA [Moritella sp. JT01]|uniref:metal ABC transporter substrate-binding protein n=1 Tax=Moritella sp. JT01 TaxID=756698 RepID=UPI0007960EE1|nr:metal ABC transporter substrate-binding protein [Moritella sp. JT01]KXO12908.1 Manganese ABC transporter, periplasmic-binding protein SitA [Moritella sp. JT01]